VMPVKFALFVPASVDAAAYPLMVLAVWSYVSGRTALSLWIAAGGLFFKEFLAIPLFLAVATYARAWRRERTARALWTLVGAAMLAITVILIPRLGLTVVATHQEIDPQNNLRSLARLVMNPLNLARDLVAVRGTVGRPIGLVRVGHREPGLDELVQREAAHRLARGGRPAHPVVLARKLHDRRDADQRRSGFGPRAIRGQVE